MGALEIIGRDQWDMASEWLLPQTFGLVGYLCSHPVAVETFYITSLRGKLA